MLEEYRIQYNLLEIKEPTRNYWKNLNIPIYLFLLIVNGENIDCYYKRYTPLLTGSEKIGGNFSYYDSFYHVNKNCEFIAFANRSEQTKGFARDLLIDQFRIYYSHGHIANFKEIDIGLKEFPSQVIFTDLAEEYRENITKTYIATGSYLKSI